MDLEIFGISVVLVIIGLIQLAKNVGLPTRYAGVAAVVLGVLASLGYAYFAESTWLQALFVGLALGLSAAGLYSAGKAAVGK